MKLKKTFHLKISSHTFVYEQATAMECLEFLEEMQSEGFDSIKWVISFLLASLVKPPRWKFWTHITQKEIAIIGSQYENIMNRIIETRFRGAFSHKNDESREWTPDMSPYCMIGKEVNLDPITLLKTYTFEQIDDLAQGIIWNMNEQTDEGKKKNEKTRTEHTMNTMSEEDKKILDDTIKEMMSKEFNPSDYKWGTG